MSRRNNKSISNMKLTILFTNIHCIQSYCQLSYIHSKIQNNTIEEQKHVIPHNGQQIQNPEHLLLSVEPGACAMEDASSYMNL